MNCLPMLPWASIALGMVPLLRLVASIGLSDMMSVGMLYVLLILVYMGKVQMNDIRC